jgi:hypothetical protein
VRSSVIAIALIFPLLCASPAKAADRLDAPPPNLAPTAERLATILSNHEKALGARTPGLSDTAIEDWAYTDSGASGTEHLERSGDNYHSKITAGPLVEEYGQNNGRRWHRDYNGFVSATTNIDDTTFFADRVDEDAADPKNDASVAGETQGANPAFVVEVKLSGSSHPEWIFYDAGTFLITKVEKVIRGRHRITTIFSDFRTTAGLTMPWHVHDIWDPQQFDDDYVRTALQIGVPVDSSQFAQPKDSSQLQTYSVMGFRIPATLYDDGTIIVRMRVNGRGLDMMLDTLTGENILDENVAHQLGLPSYGHVDHLPDGTQVPFYTTIPTATVGPATYKNLVIDAMPFGFQWGTHTQVVGVLGYDFLANNVFEIQYVNGGSVTVLPESTFDSSDPVPGGIAYPIELDDGTPFMTLQIGDAVSNDVALALEFDHSVFFGSFVEAHGDQFVGNKNGKQEQADLPFANDQSFGHALEVWHASVSHVSFGAVNFQQPSIIATNYPMQFSDERPIDAAFGFDFLRWFDVYIDYPHGRIIVKPNSLLLQVTHHT